MQLMGAKLRRWKLFLHAMDKTTSETHSLPKPAASAKRGLRQRQHKSWRTVERQQSSQREYLLEEYMLALLTLFARNLLMTNC